MTMKVILNVFKRASKYQTSLKILKRQSESVRHNGQMKTDKRTNSDLQNRSWRGQYRIVTLTII